jgi:GNAT superfamily N-acetyltransferase
MSETPHAFEMTTAPDARDREFLDQGLIAFNNARSPEYAALSQPEGKQQPVDVYVRDEQGGILGGIACTTYWGWLYIGLLWLDDRVRGRHYGARLMAMAEDEARRRGCMHSRVSTYSFQARGFYEKMGYRVVGELTGFPPGGAFYLMRKDW